MLGNRRTSKRRIKPPCYLANYQLEDTKEYKPSDKDTKLSERKKSQSEEKKPVQIKKIPSIVIRKDDSPVIKGQEMSLSPSKEQQNLSKKGKRTLVKLLNYREIHSH